MSYAILADAIQRTDFDHVFRIEGDAVTDVPGIYAPDVVNDPDNDVEVQGDGWSCLTGMTGQYSYNGAVMHPSEYIGEGIARKLAELSWEHEQNGERIAFAIVEVRDGDYTYPEGDPIGWAIAYRVIGD